MSKMPLKSKYPYNQVAQDHRNRLCVSFPHTMFSDINWYLEICRGGSVFTIENGEFCKQSHIFQTANILAQNCLICVNVWLWSLSITTGNMVPTPTHGQPITTDQSHDTYHSQMCFTLTWMLTINTWSSHILPCVILSALLKEGAKLQGSKSLINSAK